jgi:hypothetical protein
MRVAAAALLLAGCAGSTYVVGRVTPAAKLTSDGFNGGELSASIEGEGVGLLVGVQGEQLSRNVPDGTQRRVGGGFHFGLRLSLFGMIDREHRIDHWFDIGGSAAAGGGLVYPARLTTFGEAYAGAWVAFGLWPSRRHPSLVLETRRVAITDWDDMTVFTIGISLTERYVDSLRWHD